VGHSCCPGNRSLSSHPCKSNGQFRGQGRVKDCRGTNIVDLMLENKNPREWLGCPGSLARTHHTVDQSNRRDTGKSPVGLGRGSRLTQTGCWGS